MAAALVSAFTGRPVHGDLAMTGEITLSGQVLRGGGIEEKVARGAPLRAGPRRPAAGEPPAGRRGPRRQRGRSPTRSSRSTTSWSWGGGLRRRRLRCGADDSGRAGVLRAWEEGAGGNTGHEGVRRPWPAVAEHGKHRVLLAARRSSRTACGRARATTVRVSGTLCGRFSSGEEHGGGGRGRTSAAPAGDETRRSHPSGVGQAVRNDNSTKGVQAVDTYDMINVLLVPVAFFNVGVALFLYASLGHQIGQLRQDIRRFAKRKRPDRRRPRSEPDARR